MLFYIITTHRSAYRRQYYQSLRRSLRQTKDVKRGCTEMGCDSDRHDDRLLAVEPLKEGYIDSEYHNALFN